MPHRRSKYRPAQIDPKRRRELNAILLRIKATMIPTPLNRVAKMRNDQNRAAAFVDLNKVLEDMDARDGQVWPVLTLIEQYFPPKKLTGEEGLVIRAMFADLVAPWLSGSTRGCVNRRYYYAKEIDQPCLERNAVGRDAAE
jgi:hypothetical protein